MPTAAWAAWTCRRPPPVRSEASGHLQTPCGWPILLRPSFARKANRCEGSLSVNLRKGVRVNRLPIDLPVGTSDNQGERQLEFAFRPWPNPLLTLLGERFEQHVSGESSPIAEGRSLESFYRCTTGVDVVGHRRLCKALIGIVVGTVPLLLHQDEHVSKILNRIRKLLHHFLVQATVLGRTVLN